MPRFRSQVSALVRYQPGKPIEELARELGFEPDDIAKLASNESPFPPFPQVQEAIGRAAGQVNRYPNDGHHDLRFAVARHLDVPADHLWFGAGSSELIICAARAVGGSGTSAVYARPSFMLYAVGARLAGMDAIEVPTDGAWRHDLLAMKSSIRSDTTLVFVCNPNNPTGTYVPQGDVAEFVDRLPSDVLVLVDEAYFEFVRASDYGSSIPLALERDNVVVTRTFSKVYSLAGLRVGYAVGRPETLHELRKAQPPFTVNAVAQVAAIEALRHPALVGERIDLNADGLTLIEEQLVARRIPLAGSQANFVWCRLGLDSQQTAELFEKRGVIIRPFSDGWQRVTVGTEEENRRFISNLDELKSGF